VLDYTIVFASDLPDMVSSTNGSVITAIAPPTCPGKPLQQNNLRDRQLLSHGKKPIQVLKLVRRKFATQSFFTSTSFIASSFVPYWMQLVLAASQLVGSISPPWLSWEPAFKEIAFNKSGRASAGQSTLVGFRN
jgi:hypothetical protein